MREDEGRAGTGAIQAVIRIGILAIQAVIRTGILVIQAVIRSGILMIQAIRRTEKRTVFCRLILLMSVLSSFLFTTGFARAAEYASGQVGYLKSATYYSDDWVINFWNSESKHMEEELARIAEDGFNNIILAVPWREFQPEISPCTYNDYAWNKLDQVMEAAAGQGLSVMLRVGYTWDYYGQGSPVARFQQLLYDEKTEEAWLAYAGRLYIRASAHENFCGGFITWEDFWNFTEDSAHFGNSSYSREMARKYGYTAYAREHYSLEELEEIYGHSLDSYEDLYFPSGTDYARKVFYSYYDQFLNTLLKKTQAVFPDLSMEVRMDVDPVQRPDGSKEGFMHWSTFSCQSASYVSTMYGIPMGFPNEYERITAEEALQTAPALFSRVHGFSGGKALYVDQFLFTDNTAGFEYNAQLRDDQKGLYLEQIAPVLRSMTMGYGIWTYRDYGDNKLYNSQFALGTDGWIFMGGSHVAERNGSRQAVIPTGGKISQDLGKRITGTMGQDTHVSFQLEGEGDCRVTVYAGNQSRTIEADEASLVELTFKNCAPSEISIRYSGSGEAYVDDVKVYTFVTQGELYNMDGSEGSCIDALRRMNQKL